VKPVGGFESHPSTDKDPAFPNRGKRDGGTKTKAKKEYPLLRVEDIGDNRSEKEKSLAAGTVVFSF